MKGRGIIALLAMGHGINDLVAGYFLGSFLQLRSDPVQLALALVVYNLLAFGGQYPVALWLEKFYRPSLFLKGAYALNLGAVILFPLAPHLSIVFTGIASAIYHVAGGRVCAQENSALPIGLFAAPGVAGLIVGGYLAWTNAQILPGLTLAVFCFLGLLFIFRNKIPAAEKSTEPSTGKPLHLEQHDLVMILLLLVISMRSAIWNIFQLVHDQNYPWLLAIAGAAFVGKIMGGWLADRVGWRFYLMVSLLTSAPLIIFFKNELLLFCIGIGLLQSGIPASTCLLIRSMKGQTERAIGLSFGTAILAGGLLLYTPLTRLFVPGIFLLLPIAVMLVIVYRLKA